MRSNDAPRCYAAALAGRRPCFNLQLPHVTRSRGAVLEPLGCICPIRRSPLVRRGYHAPAQRYHRVARWAYSQYILQTADLRACYYINVLDVGVLRRCSLANVVVRSWMLQIGAGAGATRDFFWRTAGKRRLEHLHAQPWRPTTRAQPAQGHCQDAHRLCFV